MRRSNCQITFLLLLAPDGGFCPWPDLRAIAGVNNGMGCRRVGQKNEQQDKDDLYGDQDVAGGNMVEIIDSQTQKDQQGGIHGSR